ncbi:MAG: plastocyanin/azurin family copper-binding protein [Longimicrobiales bacterium]
MKNLQRFLSLVLASGFIAFSGCDGSGGYVLARDGDAEVVGIVLTQSLTFEPDEVTISPGTTVRWTNAAPVFHTITPDDHNEWIQATVQEAGETFEHTFQRVGVFPYYCAVHRDVGMTGVIIVE